MDRTAAASGAYHAFGPTLSSCVLAVLARAISKTVIIIIIIKIAQLIKPFYTNVNISWQPTSSRENWADGLGQKSIRKPGGFLAFASNLLNNKLCLYSL